MADPDTITINIGIPRELHRRIQLTAHARDGMSLKAAFIEAAELWIAEHRALALRAYETLLDEVPVSRVRRLPPAP